MSRKGHKAGGKYASSHTTVVPLAEKVCNLIYSMPEISKIVTGFIKAGLKPAGGRKRVKIIDSENNVLLSVRDNVAHQEIRVYALNIQDAKLGIARRLRDAGINISFRDLPD